jgi:hypothetical protein
MAMRCLPRLRMMRLWGPATDAGTVGAASGKGITLFVMSGDCTSQPPSQVQSLAAHDVANRAVRSVAPGLAWLYAFQLARSPKNAQPYRGQERES